MTERPIVVSATVLAMLGIALSLEHLLDGQHYNPGFYEFPFVTRLHVVLGAAYLALAMPQFLAAVRVRRPGVHRGIGRAAAAAGAVAGSAALVMMALFPFSGALTILVAGPFACLFVFSLARGVLLARSGRYPEHREWMIRAFAIGTGIATMRLIFVPALFAFGEATDERARWLSVVCFGTAFAVHSAIAELWIRATRTNPETEAVGWRQLRP
jgi:uncharacterized membrane protein